MKQSIKELVRPLLHRIGLDVNRYVPELPFAYLPPSKWRINVMELAIRHRLTQPGDFNFVQIGAYDGIEADPIRDIVLRYKLRGLLVEPLPDMFEKLRTNYASQPQLMFENAAVSEVDGTISFFRFRPGLSYANEHVQGLSSVYEDKVRGMADSMGLKDCVDEIKVPSLSIPTLLAKHGVEKVGLLQLDAEGLDFQLIKLAFSAGVFPEMINFELLGLTNDDRLASMELLASHGYRFSGDNSDLFAIRSSDITSTLSGPVE